MYTKLYIYSHNKTLHYVQLFVTRTRNIENAVDVQQHISLAYFIYIVLSNRNRAFDNKKRF